MTTVTSGRCVPPAYGAFSTYTSPGRIASPRRRMISCTDSPIEPRCTGMCGAFAIRLPCSSNSAQEKSSRSLMFTDVAVFASVTPICSAMDMNRLLNTSSSTGSARVPMALARCSGCTRRRTRWFSARDLGLPAGLDHDRRVALADDGRSRDRLAAAAARRDRRTACRATARRRTPGACRRRRSGFSPTRSSGVGLTLRSLAADADSDLSRRPPPRPRSIR